MKNKQWSYTKTYHTCRFSSLTINFSEVWPRQIFELRKQFNLMTPCKTSWRSLEDIFADVLKTSWQEVLKMTWQDVLKTSWRRLEDEWLRWIHWSWSRRLEDILKTSSEGEWLRRIYSSWSRRLEDVFKTSSEDEGETRLQGVFKTSSSRQMFAGRHLLRQLLYTSLLLTILPRFSVVKGKFA